MDTKPIKGKSGSVYTPEELEPRDHAADEAWADAWIERNREQIERDIEKARESFRQGRYTSYSKPGELAAEMMKRVRRRLAQENRRLPKRKKS
jgi:Txe/YoeB family toxin of Txe-Axe toxin-antitoxin module